MYSQTRKGSRNGAADPRRNLVRIGRALSNVRSILFVMSLAIGLQLFASLGSPNTARAGETRMGATYQSALASSGASGPDVSSSLDMRDDEYNSDLIFSMTKGVASSTIIPAIKPFFFLITIPLDLAFLPLMAVAGFF